MSSTKKISLIAAIAENNVIGNENKLLWHLPNDLRFFKEKTTGHHIIMGRNTYESIGGGRLLPNRTSVIVTKNKSFEREGAIIAHSLEEAIAVCPADEEIFIIGGAQIYKQAIPLAQTLYITQVAHEFTGDTYFPEINLEQWALTQQEQKEIDEKHIYKYSFLTYKRKD